MYKVFKLNKNNKIEFTKDELRSLLDEVYREGGKDNNDKYYYWTPPYNWPGLVYCNVGHDYDCASHEISITPTSIRDSATTATTSIPTSTITTSSTSGNTSIINCKDIMKENKTTVRYGDN